MPIGFWLSLCVKPFFESCGSPRGHEQAMRVCACTCVCACCLSTHAYMYMHMNVVTGRCPISSFNMFHLIVHCDAQSLKNLEPGWQPAIPSIPIQSPPLTATSDFVHECWGFETRSSRCHLSPQLHDTLCPYLPHYPASWQQEYVSRHRAALS